MLPSLEFQQPAEYIRNMLIAQVQVLAQVFLEMAADGYRILVLQADPQAGLGPTLRLEVEDLGLRRMVDDGEVVELVVQVQPAVIDDAVVADLDQDLLRFALAREHQDQGGQQDDEGEEVVGRVDGIAGQGQGDQGHPDIPALTPLHKLERRGLPNERILRLHDVVQEFLGIGHTWDKYTISPDDGPLTCPGLPDSARIVNLGRRKVRAFARNCP